MAGMADMPIIDAHHHIWRQADLPWLMGPMLHNWISSPVSI